MAWNRGLPDDEAFRDSIRDIWAEPELIERFWTLVDILNRRPHVVSREYRWLAAATALRLRQ